MDVQALVLNQQVLEAEGFHRWQPDFTKVADNAPIEPEPLVPLPPLPPDDELAPGIHLRWQLPAALCRAQSDRGGGGHSFPLVPNRWLAVRHTTPKQGAGSLTGAWLVHSDYLGADGASAIPDAPDGKGITTTRLGRIQDLMAKPWSEPSRQEPFLTAQISGLPTFAAFQPYHHGVFSLHDPLTAREKEFGAKHSYLVTGWYTEADVPAAWSAQDFRRFGWSLGRALPGGERRTFCTGTVLRVPWDDKLPVSGRPESDDIRVAVGTSGVDAFAETLCHPKTLKELGVTEPPDFSRDFLDKNTLTALHHGTLDALAGDADSEFRFAQYVHQASFAARPSGSWWTLTERGAPAKNHPHDADKLSTLNSQQSRYENMAGQLRARQHRLLYLSHLADLPLTDLPRDLEPKEVAAKRDALATDTNDFRQWLADRLFALPDPHTPDDPRLHPALRGRVVAAPRSAYHRSADPVIVLLGAHPATDLTGTALRCRWPDELPPPDNGTYGFLANLPDEVRRPLAELQKLANDLQGTAGWKAQPWQPLFVEWEVQYTPVPMTRKEPLTRADKANWNFDGTDYRWSQNGAQPERVITVRGRQVLGPHLSRTLLANVDRYRATHPDLREPAPKELDRLAAAIKKINPLSQTLAGLTDQLAQRRPPTGRLHHPDVDQAIDRAPEHRCLPGATTTGHEWPPSAYHDLRAGLMAFSRLVVVDVFGRTLDIITDDNKGMSRLLLPPDLRGDQRDQVIGPYHRTVELRPRLTQSARTRFDFVSATDDTVSSEQRSPLCGWVWPNYVDSSLLFFDPDGRPLVSLVPLAGQRDKAAALPLPGFAHPHLNDLQDPRLRHLKALVTDSCTGPAFTTLYEAIERILPTITPHHPEGAQHHASLTGRPLALVRVRLGIELDGPPLTDPSWQHLYNEIKQGTAPPSPFLTHTWPVRLGNSQRLTDGLIGFHAYEQNSLPAIGSLHPADRNTPGNYIHCTPEPPGQSEKAHHLTVLMDPHAPLHAATGILPVADLRLPDRLSRGPLSRLRISYRIGPLLAGQREKRLVMPLPAATTDTWAWAQTRTSTCDWTYQDLTRADTTARLPDDALHLLTGYLHCQTPQEAQK
ncbi:hypothetical protein [Streptomyces monomycini]|uniref:hypothetical protein n=1 Tax=Streptomyces monomycini TaxID=371720 RepID=UPI0012FEE459|nr:hypothetical protein [Streptomyces monomycini]